MDPEAPASYSIDRESLERDCDMTFFVAGGPGGQHRNKVATGVRLTHRPSGVVVTATERRSQAANREMAMAVSELDLHCAGTMFTAPLAGSYVYFI